MAACSFNAAAVHGSRAFRDGARRRDDLARLVVREPVIVAEVRTRYMLVKVLGLDVEREEIGGGLAETKRFVHVFALRADELDDFRVEIGAANMHDLHR